MKKEDYQKLNSYLNEIFKYMEEEDKFLLENYNLVFLLSEKLYNKLQDIDTEYYQVTNDLTFMDVYNIAREIIESINPNYLKLYDKIMNNGELNFSFNGEEDNYFLNLDDKNIGLINIMREYNYQDVIKLVHEFAHYINIKGKKSTNIGYILEEFIARKFELYAIKYLMDKEIPEEEINPHVTVDLLLDDLYNFIYSYPLLVSYYNFGSIDEKTSELFSKYFCEFDSRLFTKLACLLSCMFKLLIGFVNILYQLKKNIIPQFDYEEKYKNLLNEYNKLKSENEEIMKQKVK